MCPTVWFYLAEIYRILDEFPVCTLSTLAERMGVSVQATSRMIKQMADNGHVNHEPYKGVTLTPSGERIALKVIRRHRILEAYLVNVMGFGWDEAHDLTDTLERAANDKLIDRMFEMAGRPTRCPHGEPIPTADGRMPVVQDIPLPEWPVGEPAQISRVKTRDSARLQYLARLELLPGQPLTITEHAPFDGPIHLDVTGETVALGRDLAADVYLARQ
ncbi:MAG: metal-dependent transcriptional regulator [Chloroflexi bacterium]|nr:metal-dependent transcriptional regulator [Chloroflexota bacterium]